MELALFLPEEMQLLYRQRRCGRHRHVMSCFSWSCSAEPFQLAPVQLRCETPRMTTRTRPCSPQDEWRDLTVTPAKMWLGVDRYLCLKGVDCSFEQPARLRYQLRQELHWRVCHGNTACGVSSNSAPPSARLASGADTRYKMGATYKGTVKNGVVVLPADAKLVEGTAVEVIPWSCVRRMIRLSRQSSKSPSRVPTGRKTTLAIWTTTCTAFPSNRERCFCRHVVLSGAS